MAENSDATNSQDKDTHLAESDRLNPSDAPQADPLRTDKDAEDLENPNDINEISAKRTDAMKWHPILTDLLIQTRRTAQIISNIN